MKTNYIYGLVASGLLHPTDETSGNGNSIDTGVPGTEEDTDPLAGTGDEVDQSYPILPAAKYQVIVKSAEIVPGKKDPSSQLIKIAYANAKGETTVKGEQVEAGEVQFTQHILITPTGKMTEKMIKKAVARFAVATGNGSLQLRELVEDIRKSTKDSPSCVVDKPLTIKVAVASETTDFPERNEVKEIVLEG
jgi:hypothetical protein